MDLSPGFLAKLELLRIATRRVHSGRYAARTRSRRLGAGIDFADHRAYTPGDDLKYVDWTLYGRLDQLMIRLSEEETELNVHLLVDVSRSMELDVGPVRGDTKARVAREVATALSYVALSNLDQVHLWPFAGNLGRPFRPARRRAEVLRLWRHLGEVELEPGTDIEGAVRRMLQLTQARGVAILISDFPGTSWRTAVDRLLHERFDVGLVQLSAPGEIELPLLGERFDLQDGETGEVLRGVSREQVDRIRREGRRDRRDVGRYCVSRGIPLVQTVTGDPTDLEHLVLTLLRGKGLLR